MERTATPAAYGTLIPGLDPCSFHSLALDNSGTVWAWGYNSSGQLGDGTTIDRSASVPVSGPMTNVVLIAAGCWHSLAVKSDGMVWAWGDDYLGQLGGDWSLMALQHTFELSLLVAPYCRVYSFR